MKVLANVLLVAFAIISLFTARYYQGVLEAERARAEQLLPCEAAWIRFDSLVGEPEQPGTEVRKRLYRNEPPGATVGPFGLLIIGPNGEQVFPLDCRDYRN